MKKLGRSHVDTNELKSDQIPSRQNTRVEAVDLTKARIWKKKERKKANKRHFPAFLANDIMRFVSGTPVYQLSGQQRKSLLLPLTNKGWAPISAVSDGNRELVSVHSAQSHASRFLTAPMAAAVIIPRLFDRVEWLRRFLAQQLIDAVSAPITQAVQACQTLANCFAQMPEQQRRVTAGRKSLHPRLTAMSGSVCAALIQHGVLPAECEHLKAQR